MSSLGAVQDSWIPLAATRADKFVGAPGAVAMVAVGTGVSVAGMGLLVAVGIGELVADGTGVSVGTGVLVAGGVHCQTSVLAGTGTTAECRAIIMACRAQVLGCRLATRSINVSVLAD